MLSDFLFVARSSRYIVPTENSPENLQKCICWGLFFSSGVTLRCVFVAAGWCVCRIQCNSEAHWCVYGQQWSDL